MLLSVLDYCELNISVLGLLIGRNKQFDNVILGVITFYRLNESPVVSLIMIL